MLLAFDQVKKTYSVTEGEIEVLRGVNFEITAGKTIALVCDFGLRLVGMYRDPHIK